MSFFVSSLLWTCLHLTFLSKERDSCIENWVLGNPQVDFFTLILEKNRCEFKCSAIGFFHFKWFAAIRLIKCWFLMTLFANKLRSLSPYRKAHWCPYSRHSSMSSQIPLGPGAYPSAHSHSNPPFTLAQVPLPQMRGFVRHSFSSTQLLPSGSKVNPLGHSHLEHIIQILIPVPIYSHHSLSFQEFRQSSHGKLNIDIFFCMMKQEL